MSNKNYRDEFPRWAERIERSKGQNSFMNRVMEDIAACCDGHRERIEKCVGRLEAYLQKSQRSGSLPLRAVHLRNAYDRWRTKEPETVQIQQYIFTMIAEGDLEELMDEIDWLGGENPGAAREAYGIAANVLSKERYRVQLPDLQERFRTAPWRFNPQRLLSNQIPVSSHSSRPGQSHG